MHVKSIEQHTLEHEFPQFLVKVDDLHPDDPVEHHVCFSAVAIADRMAVYGLETPEEAVEALLHEHDARLNNRKQKRKVSWHTDAKVTKVLERHKAFITKQAAEFKAEVE